MRLGFSSLAALFIAWTSAIAQGGDLVLEHARIYASPTATPIVDGTLLIRDGLIAAVGSRGSVRTPKGAATVESCAPLILVAGELKNFSGAFRGH